MVTVAFYTPTGSYPEEAKLLRASLDRAGMAHDIRQIADRGGWDENTSRKAHFIRRMRREHTGPLLYIDVDAFVHENCGDYFEDLARQGVDFGAHWFRGPAKGHDTTAVRKKGWRMLSGTLFFGDTEPARALLDVWCGLNDACQDAGWIDGGGQRNLWALVTAHQKRLRIQNLPGRYTWAFDKPWAYPDEEYPVIEHTVASREHRGDSEGRVHEGRRARIAELKEEVAADAT